jgi:penicillin-binding protein 2
MIEFRPNHKSAPAKALSPALDLAEATSPGARWFTARIGLEVLAGVLYICFVFFLTGCVGIIPGRGTPTPSGQATLAALELTGLPDPKATARAYLDAWKAADYPAMYALLTSISQSALSEAEFTQHYQGVADEASLSGIDYEILAALTNPEQAQVNYRVNLNSALVGNIQADTQMSLSLERGQWRVQWDDTLVLPQLAGANYLSMDRQDYLPARANIYDRNGNALVAQADATAVGLYPDQLDPAQSEQLYAVLTDLTGWRREDLQARIANVPAGAGWYLPLGEFPADQVASRSGALNALNGVTLEPYKARYYFDNGVASHVVGYLGEIPADQLEEYEKRGYQAGDRVGLSGLEKWGDQYLAGQRGGALYVRDTQGQPVTRLAETDSQPGQSIYTTIDRDFQEGVQLAMGRLKGAAVVLERDTGRVLAMASSPDFDPNAFEPVNFNSESLLADLNNPNQPLLNRAAQGEYPLGSVFKIITMAAALESGDYKPGSTYYCDQVFKELPGVILYDWTYEYKFPASGTLNLIGGLIRSCNPWFYHIGLDLYDQQKGTLITEMARNFGLGSPTGIVGLDEAAGQVPQPQSQIDATNQAIGQGDLLVTPLQVADFMAALGNGGTIYRPQLVEKIVDPDGKAVLTFKPEERGKLPIKPETLQAIREGLEGVVSSVKPRGTAQHVFTGLDIPVAGKTGTAQTGISAPHAWFAGYTAAVDPEHPDIAVVVILERIGEGSDYAAPVFRRIVELYFRGLPGKLYDWETTYNVTRTPSPDILETPTP